MSAFGRYGVGGKVPGKYPAVSDDNNGNFDLKVAVAGTSYRQPDSIDTGSSPESFGAAEHNPAGAKDDSN